MKTCESVELLLRLYPNLQVQTLKFDLGFMALTYRSQAQRVAVFFKNSKINGWFNVVDFWFIPRLSKNCEQLGLIAVFVNADNTVTSQELLFQNVPMEIY